MTLIRRSIAANRLAYAAAGLFIGVLCALALFDLHSANADARSATTLIAPARAAALIQATSGAAATQVKAIGEDARLINAGMPFDTAPVKAARAFVLGASDDLDHRRALLCLTQAVYYEAGYEPIDGRRAVAQVVLNRMRHPAFPKSVCGVVYQGWRTPVCQFSFVCDGALYRRPEAGAWRQAQDIAAAALAGYVAASVGSATHYHADYVAPYWAPMLAKVAKLGAHIFYRWPGAWGMPTAFTGHYIGEPNDPLSMRPPLRPAAPLLIVDGQQVVAPTGPVTDGTLLKRAPNDVGGLLDTSKGWTLTIPMPGEASSASRAVADSQQKLTAAPASAATASTTLPAGAPTVLASR